MPEPQETSASAAGTTSNSHNNANGGSWSGGDRLKVQGSGAAGGASSPAATATPSPQRPRHHFTRSLSELSSPLRLRRQSQGQSQNQSPAPGHSQSPSLNLTQSQSWRNGARDNQDSRGASSQTTSSAGPTANSNGNGSTISPSQSPRLNPLGKSRTVGGINGSLATSSTAPHQGDPGSYYYGSNSSNRNSVTSSTASPNTSRRPSVHTGAKDSHNPDDYRLQPSQTAQDGHHHHHHHHHLHHSLSTSSGLGYMSGHSTTIAALTAAATAVAAASPATPATSLPSGNLAHAQTNTTGIFPGSETERSQDELLLQQERQASTASGAGLPIDPAAVRAAAAALEKMQREQSRKAARVLRSAVTDLDNLSTATSQRLDAAYGSVLSRLSALQDTVLALRSLASAARATNRRFTAEAEAIAHEIDQQVTQLEVQGPTANGVNKEGGVVLTPADQQHRLEQLSERVHRGRKAIQDLAERVETARSRVEMWERGDRAWQERTRTRLKVLWVIVSSVLLVLVVLLAVMLQQHGGGATNGDAVTYTSEKPNYPPGFSEIASTPSSSGKFQLAFPNGSAHSTTGGGGTAATGEEEDPLLHLFDEL